MLTQNELRTFLNYNPETGIFLWRDYPLPSGKARRRYGKASIGSIAGSTDTYGYREIRINYKMYKAHRLAWLYVYGAWPEGEIDHANGVPGDNRIANLRLATRAHQNANTRRRRDNKSGYKGVCRYGDRFHAFIGVGGGKTKYLGSFATGQEAHAAYLDFAKKIYGEFARAA
ncbi:HNH endonuclease [Nitrobacter hamburgensis]|uniref:HNH endonuclease n=1 Tax=Nitrobacter hamburgensis TaxID=912 RepID=UPI001FD9D102|nr:HNH endonuclease [Nitrobacter hamburgensis]